MRAFAILAAMTPDDLRLLETVGVPWAVAAGRMLIERGQPGTGLYVIVDGTVIVEACHTSGARVQARLALAQGRPVFLLEALLEQDWAKELATRAGTHVVKAPGEIVATIERLTASEPLVA